jgi:CRP-like cAMP-binding protein
MEELIEKIKSIINFSTEAEDYLLSISHKKNVSKGTILFRQGQRVDNIYFVRSGCLRSFLIDKNGKEHTLQFAIKDWWISDYIAIHNKEFANLTVECLSDSNIIQFNAVELNDILTKFPNFEKFQRILLERHMVTLQIRILDQMRLSAAERYDFFLDQYGDIEKHTLNYHIASYLGITQESLSRIRVNKTKK